MTLCNKKGSQGNNYRENYLKSKQCENFNRSKQQQKRTTNNKKEKVLRT